MTLKRLPNTNLENQDPAEYKDILILLPILRDWQLQTDIVRRQPANKKINTNYPWKGKGTVPLNRKDCNSVELLFCCLPKAIFLC